MIMVESAPTALRRSGRANRAMYMIFIKMLQAMLLSLPVPVPTALVTAFADDAPLWLRAVPAFVEDALALAFGISSVKSNGSLASSRSVVGAEPTLLLG